MSKMSFFSLKIGKKSQKFVILTSTHDLYIGAGEDDDEWKNDFSTLASDVFGLVVVRSVF
jgi:hypothetical protein